MSGRLLSFRTMWRRLYIALLLAPVVMTCLGQERNAATEHPTYFCCGNWGRVMCTEIRVRIMDSKTRQPLKGRKVVIRFSDMGGQWYNESGVGGWPLIMTTGTGPGGLVVFSVKKPIPPLMKIADPAAYRCSRSGAFRTREILENGVIASWPLSDIQKADPWCTLDPHVTEPQKRPGEVVFFVHPLSDWQNFWYTLLN